MSLLLEINYRYLPELLLDLILLDTPDGRNTVDLKGDDLLKQHSAMYPVALVEILDMLQTHKAIRFDFGDTTIGELYGYEEQAQYIEKLNITRLINIDQSVVDEARIELSTPNSALSQGMYSFVLFHCSQKILRKHCLKHDMDFLPSLSKRNVINLFPEVTTFLDLNDAFDFILGNIKRNQKTGVITLKNIARDYVAGFMTFYITSRALTRAQDLALSNCESIETTPLMDMVLKELFGFEDPIELSRWSPRPNW
ncbi:MAG: hypothetical protein V7752_07590 [Halopseudomonas sp.]